jgi:tetratricopeptide (TPR) repeat protein
LAAELPEALALVAQKHTRERQWRMAEQAHRERLARSSLNDYWAVLEYGEFLVEVGRAQEAVEYLQRARSINPVMAVPVLRLAMAHDALGHRARAFELHRNAQRFVAYDFTGAMGHFWRMLGRGESEDARRFLADFFEVDLVEIAKGGDMPPALADSPSNRMLVTAIVHLDDRARGLAELRAAYADPRMGHWVGMLNMALLAAHFDDPDLSVAALHRAVPHAPSGHGIWSFVWIPLMQPVRAHPKFEDLVRESELPSYWREAGWPEHCRPLGDDDFECG